MSKQTRITIETESLLVLHGRTSRRIWCSQCVAEVEVIALEEGSEKRDELCIPYRHDGE
jgi:hypothetical protein